MVADIEELEKMDASEIHARRLIANEVLPPMSGEKFIFPITDGTVKLSGGDQVLRTSTLIWDNPDRGEEQGNLLGESDGSSPQLQDSSPDVVKQEMISGPCQGTAFTVITLNQKSNGTCREKNHSQFHYDAST